MEQEVVLHWDACLGCMACVDACPSGVQYNRLIEQVRPQVERRFARGWRARASRAALFAVLPHPRRMRSVATAVAVTQALGLRKALRLRAVQRLAPKTLLRLDDMAPSLRFAELSIRAPRHLTPVGRRALRVALLTGCVQDAFFAHVNRATARVLAAHGCEVLVPPAQSCCGALELHAGRERPALQRMRNLIAQMEALDVDRIVVNTAGCGSAMKEYGALLADDPFWAARAASFSARVRDVMELIADLEVQLPFRLHPLPARVAYHDACHLVHAQGVRAQPRSVLGRIPDLELVDLRESDVLLRERGNLQPRCPAGRRRSRQSQGGARRREWRGAARRGQWRLPAPDPGRDAACGTSAVSGPPGGTARCVHPRAPRDPIARRVAPPLTVGEPAMHAVFGR